MVEAPEVAEEVAVEEQEVTGDGQVNHWAVGPENGKNCIRTTFLLHAMDQCCAA